MLVFYEGLLGGAAYVNTFYKITKEVSNYPMDNLHGCIQCQMIYLTKPRFSLMKHTSLTRAPISCRFLKKDVNFQLVQ